MSTLPPGDAGPLPDFLQRLQPHPIAEWFELMDGAELENLIEDISKNGLLEPIILFEVKILDGRNRYRACLRASYKFRKEDFVELPKGVDPLGFIFSKNMARRHLTAEQKRAVIAKLLKEHPEASSRAIAAIAQVSHHTVEAVRQEAAPTETGQSAQLPEATPPKRKGRDGKERRSPTKRQPSTAQLKKKLDDFKEDWEALNDWQKRAFVKAFKDELAEIVEEIEAEIEAEQQEAEQPAAH
jgi:ParB-like chromosome segregation protein Spo0J